MDRNRPTGKTSVTESGGGGHTGVQDALPPTPASRASASRAVIRSLNRRWIGDPDPAREALARENVRDYTRSQLVIAKLAVGNIGRKLLDRFILVSFARADDYNALQTEVAIRLTISDTQTKKLLKLVLTVNIDRCLHLSMVQLHTDVIGEIEKALRTHVDKKGRSHARE